MIVVRDTILQDIPPASVAWLDSLRASPEYQYQHASQSRSIWSIIVELIQDYLAEIFDGSLNSTADYVSIMALCAGVAVLIYMIRHTGAPTPFSTSGASLVRNAIVVSDVTVDLKSLSQAAERDEQYALALRYTYLSTLAALNRMGRIVLQQHRTDTDYLRDLRSDPAYPRFRRAVDVFRRAWYGGVAISREEYVQTRQIFDEIGGGQQ